jgi:hypothetical protein
MANTAPLRLRARSWLAIPLALSLAACAQKQPEPPPPVPPAVPAQTGSQRLSIAQYVNAVHDVFGADIAVPTALEPDTSLSGFVSIGGAQSAISPRGVEQYEDAAFKIAAQALAPARRAALVPCTPTGPADDACARAFATKIGRRVWRRALTPDEVTTIAGITTQAGTTLADFYQGLAYGIAALLESPVFLYRGAAGEPDPEASGKRRYTSAEMASRLSFFLWNSTPDDALLDAADAGTLTDPAELEKQVTRMLASPRARAGLRNFVTEYLRLDQLDQLSKDPTIFTHYNPDVGPAAREETLRDFEDMVFDRDGDYRDLFTTRRTFVNPKLASLYEVLAPKSDGFAEVELPADLPRRGLLGQVSFLSLYAHPTSSSATLRGKFIRTVLLCGVVPPPPVNVNTALPEPSTTARTLREREKVHLSDPFCAGCHLQMDPIGLGLENFDGLGGYRKKDNGEVIDPSGDLDGSKFSGAVELAERVRNHPALARCFVKRMYEYATSFVETPAEAPVLTALSDDFKASGYRVKSLMLTIATSPGFRLAGSPQ